METGEEVTATERILKRGKALVRAIEALETMAPTGLRSDRGLQNGQHVRDQEYL